MILRGMIKRKYEDSISLLYGSIKKYESCNCLSCKSEKSTIREIYELSIQKNTNNGFRKILIMVLEKYKIFIIKLFTFLLVFHLNIILVLQSTIHSIIDQKY